jgi:SAM-dependent methyltransferase
VLRERPDLLEGPILDLGCGDGEVFEWIFGRRADAFGVDSGATRAEDLATARAAGRYSEVRQEDAARLSFADGTFGLVFSNSVLEHIAPVGPVLAEAHRVLRPGGYFLFTTPDPELYSKGGQYWRRVLSRVGLDLLARALARRECAAYHHVSILSFSEWKLVAERAGFTEIERHGYVPAAAARAMSRYGALTRVPVLWRLASLASPEARTLSRDEPNMERWIDRCGELFLELATHDGSGEMESCGQLILARKRPSPEPEARDAR